MGALDFAAARTVRGANDGGAMMNALAAGLPAIDLATLNGTAAMMTRIDRKYVVSPEHLPAIIMGCHSALARVGEELSVLEIGGLRGGRYASTYFDTPALTSFLAAARPRRQRVKIRTRSYLDSDLHVLEVKARGPRGVTVKERIEIPGTEADETIHADARRWLVEQLAGVEIDHHELRPVISGSYVRTTFKAGSSGRMTIDTNVAWWQPQQCALAPREGAWLKGCVVETKSGSQPSVVDKTLWRLGYRPQKISKFGTGMAALNPALPRNRWQRVLNRWVESSHQHPGHAPMPH